MLEVQCNDCEFVVSGETLEELAELMSIHRRARHSENLDFLTVEENRRFLEDLERRATKE